MSMYPGCPHLYGRPILRVMGMDPAAQSVSGFYDQGIVSCLLEMVGEGEASEACTYDDDFRSGQGYFPY